MNEPSTNGHDNAGRFVPGNPGGPGNPHAGQVARLRSAMMAAVSDDDMREVVAKLVDLAKSGDVTATKLLMDRCLGKVQSPGPVVAIQNNVSESRETKTQQALRILRRIEAAAAADPSRAEARRQATLAEIKNPKTLQILDRIKASIDERRGAMFTGAGMEPPQTT